MYTAYKAGRGGGNGSSTTCVDPSINWYQGELDFFDYYLIPLAKKLESCGVFGVSSDEYLDYAIANRNEWKIKGHDIVKGYIKEATTTTTSGCFVPTTTTTTGVTTGLDNTSRCSSSGGSY